MSSHERIQYIINSKGEIESEEDKEGKIKKKIFYEAARASGGEDTTEGASTTTTPTELGLTTLPTPPTGVELDAATCVVGAIEEEEDGGPPLEFITVG